MDNDTPFDLRALIAAAVSLTVFLLNGKSAPKGGAEK